MPDPRYCSLEHRAIAIIDDDAERLLDRLGRDQPPATQKWIRRGDE